MMKKTCILSIDGGGIRGIMPGIILSYIEEQLRIREGDHVRLSDYFDLLSGTSTGGILICLYVVPGNDGRPKYSTNEAVDLYMQNGNKIFSLPLSRKLLNPIGLMSAKYSATNLEALLKSYLGDNKLSDALKPCMITSYEITQRKTVFFNKIDTQKTLTRDFYLRDIARGTSAAPTFFDPASIKSIYGAPYYLIDGGVFANNPSMCAFIEASTLDFQKLLGRNDKADFPNPKEVILISIGTGSQANSYSYDRAKHWGIAGWLKPILDVLMSGNSETVHYELKELFEAVPYPDHGDYYRLEPDIGTASKEMDNASSENMIALKEAGKTFVTNNIPLLNKIIDLLIANK